MCVAMPGKVIEIYECSIESKFKAPALHSSQAVTAHDNMVHIDTQNIDSLIRFSTNNAKRNDKGDNSIIKGSNQSSPSKNI